MRPDASMTLLTEVTDHSLDPGYAAAAARPQRRTPLRGAIVILLALALGVIAAVAGVDLRRPRPEEAKARAILIEQITHREAVADAAQAEVQDLTREIDRYRSGMSAAHAGNPAPTTRTDAVDTGAVPVQGPGLLVTIAEGQAYVLDTDLQEVVNALWAGGAEAIAINGHRLTSLTAIRTAGDAILVDLEPMISPYQISAIGDAGAMQVQMLRTGTSDHLRLLGTQFGIHSSVTTQSALKLPGSGDTTLYYAHSTKDR